MRYSAFLRLASSVVCAVGWVASSAFAQDTRISGPHVHENLAVYLVHGTSAAGPVPLTLQEAIARDAVRVIETGNVNNLEIENTGTQDVFVQAGDLVKGGKQDRVLTVSLLLTPGAGKVAIGAFCVEQGRWAARGTESVQRFASSGASMPSREAKLAMLMPAKPREAAVAAVGAADAGLGPQAQASPGPLAQTNREQRRADTAMGDDTSTRQREVWDKVKRTQEKLSGNLGSGVASAQSRSSLQLSLENESLKKAQAAYVAALQPLAENDGDVVGFVISVNGKLASADVYPSNGLFRKMWPKQLGASATEAIGEKKAATATEAATQAAPTIEAVKAFLTGAEQGKMAERTVGGRMKLQTREADTSLLVEASRIDGGFVHRNYLAK